MFTIKRLNSEALALEFSYSGNEYEITAVVIPKSKEISINVYVKYLYQDDKSSITNKYFIGSYPIRYRLEDTSNRLDLSIPLDRSLRNIKDLYFSNMDKVVFEVFSAKIQDLYMEVNNA